MEDSVSKEKAFKRYRHQARPLFLPHRHSYVAARPFNWKGVRLESGDPVPAEWPVHHLRHLHAQSLIGPEGHEWTEQRNASWAKRLADGRKRAKVRRQQQAEAKVKVAEEAGRSLSDRLGSLFGGGDPDGRPAGYSDYP